MSIHTECLSLARKTGDAFAIAYQLHNLAGDSVDKRTIRSSGRATIWKAYASSSPSATGGSQASASTDWRLSPASVGTTTARPGCLGSVKPCRTLTGHFRAAVYSRAHYDPFVAATRGALGDQEFTRLWNEGGAMPLDEAVDYALATADVLLSTDAVAVRPRTSAGRGGRGASSTIAGCRPERPGTRAR